jgi:RimJ/RimL family protein N-acetyltransferase
VLLRAATPDDTGFLQRLWDDVDTWLIAQSRPYVPESQAHKARRLEAALDGSNATTLLLVVEADGQAAGVAALSGIDLHNRRADVAVTLMPEARGAGYGREALAALCDYSFRLRGLHRLGAETLATNIAMQRVAESVGFVREGVLRAQDWQPAGWCDVVVYGLLAEEWAAS